MVATLAAAGVLTAVVAGHRHEFSAALQAAPLWLLGVAIVLQVVALVARSEAWHVCVRAAGGTVARRRLYRAASVGYLGSQLNSQLGVAARIAALRRSAPARCPRVPALIAAEMPILAVEAALAALTSYTLVGPLGLPWWLPLAALAVVVLGLAGLRALARGHRRGVWSGLAVLRTARGRGVVVVLVLVAVLAQIARNWLLLHAVGVDASLFDAIAVLIAMVTISQLPVGPTVGAGAVVAILGTNGVAVAAAAGVMLTATGTAGALVYVAWAAVDRLRVARSQLGVPDAVALSV